MGAVDSTIWIEALRLRGDVRVERGLDGLLEP